MGGRPTGFSFQVRGGGGTSGGSGADGSNDAGRAANAEVEVTIEHHGRPAGRLRGWKAAEFLDSVSDGGDEPADQELMARLTGNYRRGNERQAREHPRNRDQHRRR